MGLFSKVKKFVKKTAPDPFGVLKDKKSKPQQADPDPINPLTGRPRSQDVPQDGSGTPLQPFQGLGQMTPAYLPQPVSMSQRVPQGLGSDVFRSTLAPLQQQGYGLGQIDPSLLTSTVRFPGGSTMPPAQMPQQMPQQSAPLDQLSQLRQLGLLGGLGQIRKLY